MSATADAEFPTAGFSDGPVDALTPEIAAASANRLRTQENQMRSPDDMDPADHATAAGLHTTVRLQPMEDHQERTADPARHDAGTTRTANRATAATDVGATDPFVYNARDH